jgi:ribokinase
MIAPRIAVVGSYATGLTMKAARIPCGGETLLGHGYRVDFGGKGSNQAVGCARLGANVSFIAKIGQDGFGDMALDLYRQEKIDVAHILRTAEAPTGVGFIVVEESSGQNCIVLDAGANELLTAGDVAANDEVFRKATVVLTQLETPVEAAEAALSQGRAAGAVTIMNPAPVRHLPDGVLSLIDVLTPNESEAKVLAGMAANENAEPEAVARKLIAAGVKTVVMTLGEQGALLLNAKSHKHFPAVRVKPVDTTGAGDAFNAGLATAIAHGANLTEAVDFAVVIGAMAVTKEGVVPSLPRREEVLEFCRANRLAAPDWLASNKVN